MKIYRFFSSGSVFYFVAGLLLASIPGYITGAMIYDKIFWYCSVIFVLIVAGKAYYLFRPPIKIHIRRLGDCRSEDLTDRGKLCIEFLIDNFGDRTSLNPTIRMDYVLYDHRKERIIHRAHRLVKRKQKRFEVKPASTEALNLPNGQKQMVALCDKNVTDGLIAFHVLKFNFSGGGSRRAFFFNRVKDNSVGTIRFLLSLSKYALLNHLDYLDKEPT